MSPSVEVRRFLYDVTVEFTSVTEYGVPFEDLVDPEAPLPPAGARFDVGFAGVVLGPSLSGTVTGVDYLYVRPDRRLQLHIHGHIATDDGENVTLFAEGLAVPRPGTPVMELLEHGSYMTASPQYIWLNHLQLWGRGTVDPLNQKVAIKAYAA